MPSYFSPEEYNQLLSGSGPATQASPTQAPIGSQLGRTVSREEYDKLKASQVTAKPSTDVAATPKANEVGWLAPLTESLKGLARGTVDVAKSVTGAIPEMAGGYLAAQADVLRQSPAAMGPGAMPPQGFDYAAAAKDVQANPTVNPMAGQAAAAEQFFAPYANAPSIQANPTVANTEYLGNAPLWTKATKLASDVGQGAPSVAAAIGGAMVGGPAGAGVMGGALTASPWFEKARKEGLGEKNALAGAAVIGGGSAILNSIPFLEKLPDMVPAAVKGRIATFIAKGLAEAGTETAEGGLNPFAEVASGQRKLGTIKDFETLLLDAGKGAYAESGTIPASFLLGGMIPGGANREQGPTPNVPAKVELAAEASKIYEDLKKSTDPRGPQPIEPDSTDALYEEIAKSFETPEQPATMPQEAPVVQEADALTPEDLRAIQNNNQNELRGLRGKYGADTVSVLVAQSRYGDPIDLAKAKEDGAARAAERAKERERAFSPEGIAESNAKELARVEADTKLKNEKFSELGGDSIEPGIYYDNAAEAQYEVIKSKNGDLLIMHGRPGDMRPLGGVRSGNADSQAIYFALQIKDGSAVRTQEATTLPASPSQSAPEPITQPEPIPVAPERGQGPVERPAEVGVPISPSRASVRAQGRPYPGERQTTTTGAPQFRGAIRRRGGEAVAAEATPVQEPQSRAVALPSQEPVMEAQSAPFDLTTMPMEQIDAFMADEDARMDAKEQEVAKKYLTQEQQKIFNSIPNTEYGYRRKAKMFSNVSDEASDAFDDTAMADSPETASRYRQVETLREKLDKFTAGGTIEDETEANKDLELFLRDANFDDPVDVRVLQELTQRYDAAGLDVNKMLRTARAAYGTWFYAQTKDVNDALDMVASLDTKLNIPTQAEKPSSKPAAEFIDLQERPRGQEPIALYNIPTPDGGKTTVTAETAKAQGFDVPEPTQLPSPTANQDIAGPTETTATTDSVEFAISAFNDAKRKSDAILDRKGKDQGEDYAKELFAVSGNVVDARDALVEQIATQKPDTPIKGVGANGNMITVTPSSKESGRWQITSHDEKGPIRDTLLDSYKQAVKEALWDYRIQPESMEFREQQPAPEAKPEAQKAVLQQKLAERKAEMDTRNAVTYSPETQVVDAPKPAAPPKSLPELRKAKDRVDKHGLTKDQMAFLTDEIQARWSELPVESPDNKLERTNTSAVIKVPGDGTFIIESQLAANAIHKRLTGKWIDESMSGKSSEFGVSSRVDPRDTPDYMNGAAGGYTASSKSIKARQQAEDEALRLLNEAKTPNEVAYARIQYDRAMGKKESTQPATTSPMNETAPVSEETAKGNKFFWYGNEAKYTGKTTDVNGETFYEFEYLEGAKKGEKGVRMAQESPNASRGESNKPTGKPTPQVPAKEKSSPVNVTRKRIWEMTHREHLASEKTPEGQVGNDEDIRSLGLFPGTTQRQGAIRAAIKKGYAIPDSVLIESPDIAFEAGLKPSGTPWTRDWIEQAEKNKRDVPQSAYEEVAQKIVDAFRGEPVFKNNTTGKLSDAVTRLRNADIANISKEKPATTTASVPKKTTVKRILESVPSNIVSYDPATNTISFDPSDEGITKVRDAVDKALDSLDVKPALQSKYEEAHGDIMDAVFSKQEEAPKPTKGKKRSDETGAVNIGLAKDAAKKVLEIVKKAASAKSIEFSHGLGKDTKNANVVRVGTIARLVSEGEQAVIDFNEGYRTFINEGKGRVKSAANRFKEAPEDMREMLNKFLIEQDPEVKQARLEALPEPMRESAERMRTTVDALSRQLRNEGVASKATAEKIENQEGYYLRRTFKIFKDPDWKSQISEKMKDAVRKHIAKEEELDPSSTEVTRILNGYMNIADNTEPSIVRRGKKLGTKDLSTLQKRGEFDQSILDLWGVEQDGIVNFLETLTAQANLIANHRFLRAVARIGEGKTVFSADLIKAHTEVDTDPSHPDFNDEYDRLIRENRLVPFEEGAAKKDRFNPSEIGRYGAMAGSMVERDFKEAMQEAVAHHEITGMLGELAFLNSVTKAGMTALSPKTASLNFWSNSFIAAQAHHLFYGSPKAIANRMRLAMKVARIETSTRHDKGIRTLGNKLIGLGVLKDTIGTTELQKQRAETKKTRLASLMKKAPEMADSAIEKVYGADPHIFKSISNALGMGVEQAFALYQAGDDVWKTFGWLAERDMLKEAYPNWSERQLDVESALRVRRFYTTYSELPNAVKTLRHNPLIAPFVAFYAEVPRGMANTMLQAKQDIVEGQRTGNTVLRNQGLKRAGSMMVAAATLEGISQYYKMKNDVDDDDEETLRMAQPSWDKAGTFGWYDVDRVTGKAKAYSLSAMVPQAIAFDPLTAFFRAETIGQGVHDFAKELTSPLYQPEIGFMALRNQWYGIDSDNKPIFTESDPMGEQWYKRGAQFWKDMSPGAYKSVVNVSKAEDKVGKAFDELSGQRTVDVDLPKSLFYKAIALQKAGQEQNRDIGKAVKAEDREAIMEQYKQRVEAHKLAWREASDMIKGMKRFGVDDMLIVKSLKEAGLDTPRDRNRLINGNYVEPKMPDWVKKALAD